MADRVSRSWTFFGSKRYPNRSYFGHESFQGPNSRVNLENRFNVENRSNFARMSLSRVQPSLNGWSLNWRFGYGQQDNGTAHNSNYISEERNECNEEIMQYESPKGFRRFNRNEEHPNKSYSTSIRAGSGKQPHGLAPVLSNLQENVSNIGPQTGRILKDGSRKINKAFQGVRTSFSHLSQHFRMSTHRRYKFSGTPTRTPNRPIRYTPGKLYSPFDMSTPMTPPSYKAPKRLNNGAMRQPKFGNENHAIIHTPQHKGARGHDWTQFHSPSHRLHHDVSSVTQASREFDSIANNIVHKQKRWVYYR